MKPTIKAFFDELTKTITYVVSDDVTKECAIIDSVLNYEHKSGRTSTASADAVVQYIIKNKLLTVWILETHVHADHLSAAQYLKSNLGGSIAIGEHVTEVQKIFAGVFNAGHNFCIDGSQFDTLLKDGDEIKLGGLLGTAIHTPGHTPACMTFVFADAAFVGDTLFMPDYGTARTDFPGGDAATLYQSIQKIFELPDHTRLYMCHDYLTEHRKEYAWESTVAEEKSHNIHIHSGVSEKEFVEERNRRDATLPVPKLILPSVQVNMRAGHLPPHEDDGKHYLKIPVDVI